VTLSKLEKPVEIPAAMYHSQNEYIVAFDAIDNHVLAHRKATHPCAEIPSA